MAWGVALTEVALATGGMPRHLGWLTVGVLASIALVTAAPGVHRSAITWSAAGLLTTALTAWLGSLGWAPWRAS